jgi:hypothetical protein
MLAIHPDASDRDDVARLASELVEARARLAEVERERDEAKGFVDEDEALASAVHENLPECTCDSDGNLGSEIERIEFAGEEIRRLERERDAALADNAKLREALERIAAFDDEGASRRLASTGSFALFDEPGSVEIARAALADTGAPGEGRTTP